ncbi:UDP-N-acetylmuramoyl-L-alanine--D-glutamate ligase [Sutterella sp.]|uniref:UDP-N-acetylmuramoyl-L-alanine--D-glutamate ligase n=1 Tax=Sutterella sp. TaxID=1981025 RepID=UPI0026DFCA19|nr:UDP-N-acetylmuramoyl-L-alanine--D-glutamate ligase [Sutterella sp.]MDO5530837.1 UDP-N-acetylmuramoyl-L-alanine--D-glutamate ligase [Sutterella sp.]
MLEAEDLAYRELHAAEGAGRRALVVGLGASGRAAAAYLVRQGWTVEVWDTRATVAGSDAFRESNPAVTVHLGGLPQTVPEGVDLVVMSPGISPLFGAAAPLCASAREAGVPVAGEIELFAQHLAHLRATKGYEPKVVAITGTNGKTTTTSLTARLVAGSGRTVVAAGNIGPNAIAELTRAEDARELPDVWVLELSSFQLETTHTLFCDAAALLNITEDHIDWHGSLEVYAAAKARIFSPGTVRVVNREDPLALEWGTKGALETDRICSFGGGIPRKKGEFGLDMAAHASQGWWLAALDEYEIEVLYLPEQELKIRGRHNTMNALAALALTAAIGIERQSVLVPLRTYTGEPHRVELVRTVAGRDFIDDSKGTNVGAVAAAVTGLAGQGRRIRILMGGDGKGQDFGPLAEVLKGRADAVALIGKDADPIGEAIAPAGAEMRKFPTLEAAVDWLWEGSAEGDIILLSPACASWDMFRDYAERSARFKACAEAIAAREGKEPEA